MAAAHSVRPVPSPLRRKDGDGDYDNDRSDYQSPPSPPPSYSPSPPVVYGYYSCHALADLWIAEGGSSYAAFTAAEIAMAESGGNPNALSPTNDYGLWQINGSHGAEASFNPLVNARAAIAISGDGTNWTPWTTFVSGVYIGRC